jgi:hypothetical protein
MKTAILDAVSFRYRSTLLSLSQFTSPSVLFLFLFSPLLSIFLPPPCRDHKWRHLRNVFFSLVILYFHAVSSCFHVNFSHKFFSCDLQTYFGAKWLGPFVTSENSDFPHTVRNEELRNLCFQSDIRMIEWERLRRTERGRVQKCTHNFDLKPRSDVAWKI